MPSFNRVILIGRLTRDPELRYTAGGLAVTSFSIAVDRRFKNQQGERVTDFFRCKAWRQKAEFVANYVTKGRLVAVEGSIEMNEMTGQDGQKRYFTDIICDNVEILESQRDAEGGGAGAPGMGAASGAPGMGNGAGNAAGGVGGGARGAGDDLDNGYFPDEDAPAAPPPRTQNRAPGGQNAPAGRGATGGGTGGASGGGGQRGASGGAGGGRAQPAAEARRPAEPAYPDDDFDDSDPFADQ